MIKKRYSSETVTINELTGEVIDSSLKSHYYNSRKGEKFYIMYDGIEELFMGMESSEIRVYGYLLRYSSGLTFQLNKSERLSISEQTGLNERTIYNLIPKMLEKKILLRVKNDRFVMNPELVFHGGRDSRDKFLLKVKRGEV
jgi:hypothetical protein